MCVETRLRNDGAPARLNTDRQSAITWISSTQRQLRAIVGKRFQLMLTNVSVGVFRRGHRHDKGYTRRRALPFASVSASSTQPVNVNTPCLPFRPFASITESLARLQKEFSIEPPKFQRPKFGVPDIFTELQASIPTRYQLNSVQEFFQYTEEEGKRFFKELDRDGDLRITRDDLKVAYRKRNLPERYADLFFDRAKTSWFSNSIGWEEFQRVMGAEEARVLRAFNSMNITFGGALRTKQIKDSLEKMGLPPTDDNAVAMIKYLGHGDEEGFISYGSFRNFLMLLPPEKELQKENELAWFEAATFVQIAPPQDAGKGINGLLLVKAAAAGGLASGSSTALMHPLDTLKTRVQAATGATPSPKQLLASAAELGRIGLYRGIVPAAAGAAVSHALRTATYEATQIALSPLLNIPGVNEIQLQGFASGVGTLMGTAIRIPCEVLKQRLQCGLHPNVSDAFFSTVSKDGWRALFRGTAPTLAREVPFYVIGMVSYEQLKILAQELRGMRGGKSGEPLAPWQTLLVGALSGGFAAALTTPADVLKTRTMTGMVPVNMTAMAAVGSILQKEGLGALFKGALPRALWVAPLGAMNFAGYELARRAMERDAEKSSSSSAPTNGTPPTSGTDGTGGDSSSDSGPSPPSTEDAAAAAT